MVSGWSGQSLAIDQATVLIFYLIEMAFNTFANSRQSINQQVISLEYVQMWKVYSI